MVLWLCNPHYIRDVVVPTVREGCERAGRDPAAFDVVAAVPAAVTDDKDAAYRAIRRDLLTYFSLPFYRSMIERSGFAEDIAGFDAAARSGDRGAMAGAISEAFLRSLAAVGDGAAVSAGLRAYFDAGATSPCVGPISRTDVEATLRAAVAAA